MSMFIEYGNSLISFKDYCLSEAVKPSEVEYGTNSDMNDGNIEFYTAFGMLYTFFKIDGKYYLVYVHKNKGEVGFGASFKHSTNPLDYSDDRSQTRNALKVFSKVLYVLFKIIKSSDLREIRFHGANPALGKVYGRMVKNKFILSYINDFGFEYKGEEDEEYIFVKS